MRAPFFLAALVCAVACSAIVDPDSSAPRCEIVDGGDDPCPQGSACVEGRCVQFGCAGAVEICKDRLDNDCDGEVDERDAEGRDRCGDRQDNDCDDRVDEEPDLTRPETCGNAADDDCDGMVDEGHDQDQDGNQWCGDTTTAGGGAFADCDDYDPNVYYGAAERCDGVDNDCNGTIDEKAASLCDDGQECLEQRCVTPSCQIEGSSKECGAGQMCDINTGECVMKGCTDGTCGAGEYCDKTSGECRKTRRQNGDPCLAHSDCASGSCIDAAALRLITGDARVCGESCCADSDCGEGERCFASGSGARSCLPSRMVPEPADAATTCSLDAQCSGSDACALASGQRIAGPAVESRNDLVTTVCSPVEAGAGIIGEPCADVSECASRACVQSLDFFYGRCSGACRTSDDCEDLSGISGVFGPQRGYCRYLDGGAAEPSGDWVTICVIDRGEVGAGEFGTPCTRPSDCLDGACIGVTQESPGFCAPTCCNDAQCPPLDGVPSMCRPVAFGDHYEMRCVR